MTERKLYSNLEVGMSSDDVREKTDPKSMPELKSRYNNFELAERRLMPENYELELDAQAIGFIRQAMLKKHTEPNFHTPEITEDNLKKLKAAETVEEFKTAIKTAYPNPEHMLVDAAKFFEENFPANGRNGEGLDSIFETEDGTFGAEMINVRTRARRIIKDLSNEFAEPLVPAAAAGS